MNENERLEVVIAARFQELLTGIKATNTEFERTASLVKTVKANFDAAGNLKGFNVTARAVEKTTQSTKALKGELSATQRILNAGFNLGKLYLLWNVTKRIRSTILGWVKSSVDFIETTNKFEVAMGNMADKAYAFQNRLSNAFGTVTKDMMNFQATFKNIMSSIPGLTNEMSEQVSETLVKLGLDYSSLYNVDQKTAMSRIQSALVGSVKPIRSDAGYDITEATIATKAQELGLQTSVRNLNQMEKRILRIIVLMDQMRNTGAMQDFARTIEQPANQIKVLKAQVQELGVWLGNVFIGTIGKILPYINGFVMALVAIVKTLAIFVGYTNTGSGLAEGLEEAEVSAGGVASGLGSAAKSAKEIKKTLMGFDVLNVIQKPQDSSGGGSGGGGGAGGAVNPALLKALKDYDNLMGNVQMKATKIRDKIMEWLGFTKKVNDITGEVTWQLKEGYTRLELIKDLIVSAGIAFASWKLTKLLEGLGIIEKSKTWQALLGFASTGIGIYLWISGTKIAASEGITAESILKSVLGSGLAGFGLYQISGNWRLGLSVGLALTIVSVTVAADKEFDWGMLKGAADDLYNLFGIKANEENIFDVWAKSLKMLKDNIKYLPMMIEESYGLIRINDRVALTEHDLEIATNRVRIAEENLKKVRSELTNVTDEYDQAVQNSTEAQKKLEEAEKKNQISGKELYDQVKRGENSYLDMNDAQKEVYKAYLNNIDAENQEKQAQENLTNVQNKLKDSEIEFKKQKILGERAVIEYSLALLQQAGDYDTYKKALIEAFEQGKIKPKEAATALAAATSGMDKDTRKAFLEDIPPSIQEGMEQAEKNIDNALPGIKDKSEKINATIKKNMSGEIIGNMNVKLNWTNVKNTLNKIRAKITEWSKIPIVGNLFSTLKSGLEVLVYSLNAAGYASGGFPEMGELFVAREAGPELVGSIGNRNAVMNNQQIVEAVSSGVANAVASVLGEGGSSYQLIIDGEQITNVVQRRIARRANITGMAMGV